MSESNSATNQLELRIVLDTSIIHTESDTDLLNFDLRRIMQTPMPHSRLKLAWYLPEMVLRERVYQLCQGAFGMHKELTKLERLTNRNFNASRETVASSLKSHQREKAIEAGFKLVPLDVTKVNWANVIEEAIERRATFKDTDKGAEKGFRDRLILESFQQFHSEPSNSATGIIVAFVIGDNVFRNAAEELFSGNSNVRILRSVEDLNGLINTLGDENIDEQYVERIKDKARRLFYDYAVSKAGPTGPELLTAIFSRFPSELSEHPDNVDNRVNDTGWTGTDPSFEKKVGNKIYWSTILQNIALGYKKSHRLPPNLIYPSGISGDIRFMPDRTGQPPLAGSGYSGNYALNSTASGMYPFLYNTPSQQEDILVAKGISSFQVIWSAETSAAEELSALNIEEIKFKETVWGSP